MAADNSGQITLANKKVSLAELMGSAGASANGKLELNHLPKILGDAMPDLPRNSVGRHRLVSALQQRFGNNFRALPGVSGLVEQFDREVDFEDRIEKIKAVRLDNFRKVKK